MSTRSRSNHDDEVRHARRSAIHVELLRSMGRRRRAALMRELRDLQPITDVGTFLARVEADIWVYRSARGMEQHDRYQRTGSGGNSTVSPLVKGAPLRRERAERRIEAAVQEFAEVLRARQTSDERS